MTANRLAMGPGLRAAHEAAVAQLGEGADDLLLLRLERFFGDLYEPLERLFGDDGRWPAAWSALLRAMASCAAARPPALRRLDHMREITPDWLLRETELGYVAYADRFGGDLAGVRERIPYLSELGVTYLHLMSVLRPRPAPSDGGYAVVDYGAVDPALGTMEDLQGLTADLHGQGIALCIDVVLNHTAAEHGWARAAVAGDAEMLARYLTYPDRAWPDRYERTLPQVFPDTAPGNFTWVDALGRWAWTTFNPYQWDLDHGNPGVFVAFASVMLDLAQAGVDVLRLDAAPFIVKREGTDCQNQPEVHELLQAFRAVLRIAAPAVALKAEAIVAPQELVGYLGTGRHEGRECQLAYHNVLMAHLWSALAARDVRPMTRALQAMPAVPAGAGWATYVRCHDDIGWAIGDAEAAAAGWDGYLHRRFCSDFYAGDFDGSWARGARFEPEPDGSARTSGTAASLAGLEAALALGDAAAAELAVGRLLVLHAVAFAHGGLPLLYMGDELGLRNVGDWRADPARAEDNRWMHRPHMDWAAAERRHDPAALEGRLYGGLRELVALRRATVAVHAGGALEAVWTGNDAVLGLHRRHAGSELLLLANFSEHEQVVPGHDPLEPYGYRWIT